jgi:hypothetical protein
MRLHAEGPCEVTAGMIEAGADIEIMNPDLVICTLDKGAKLNMEMTVNTGKGYRPACAEPSGRSACWPDPGRFRILAGTQSVLRSGRHARWPDHGLRQADTAS